MVGATSATTGAAAVRGAADIAGRVAIVTGGSRGIGRALCEGLGAAGVNVVVASRSLDDCEATAAAIRDAGGSALAIRADVASGDDRAAVVDAAVGTFGGLDILVNNAALLKPHVTEKVTEAELQMLLDVNLVGPVMLSQLAFAHLAASGHGAIVNISALGAFQPMPGIGAYCAVKAAMVNWTSTMAKEWTPRGVRVNGLVPGPVATDMILPRDPAKRESFIEEMGAATLVGRIGQPEDLVGALLFLVSDASAFMTGRSLFLDGGMLA
jgi:NAD(P)-dependent dehydrogenase (short-subunit alcohol dehydrogenase family)